MRQTKKRIFIFVDGLDECDSGSVREVAYFWRKVTKSAHAAGVDLNVRLSSRYFPSVTRFEIASFGQEAQWQGLKGEIIIMSAGVYLLEKEGWENPSRSRDSVLWDAQDYQSGK
ncbi:uncharacterized protein FOBCDRAFT_204390 [Fusarium oxysporum Fo47]|uniref:uncharacterized protein n=1 Tax=Fusarium oxysporum Fo47 TaxID=660027 RepID=UPI0028698F20|nr:uncharacterized protein FOBCDRAFT_204390 [Fusarium oxysporum Fo47]WJG35823.1 hypothetical protein FOBCDRAFT_204390 [Fusarium oxysporum Fo47]